MSQHNQTTREAVREYRKNNPGGPKNLPGSAAEKKADAEPRRLDRQRRRKVERKAAEVMASHNAKAAHRPPAKILSAYGKLMDQVKRYGRAKVFTWPLRKTARLAKVRAIVEGGVSWK